MNTIAINENISLHYIEMKKFKTNVVGIYLRRPLSEDEAAMNAVLSYVLKSGCKRFPSTLTLTRHLEELYGATLNSGVSKNGDNQIIFFDAETIADKYAPNDEKLTDSLVELLLNVIFKPLADNNRFDKKIVEREKNTVINKIDALINDKRSYAQIRCNQEVCKNDTFSISKFGTKEVVNEINEETLFSHYQKIIASSQIDIFICGEANLESAKNVISKYTNEISFTKCTNYNTSIIKPVKEVNYVTDRLDVTQGKLSIGFTTDIDAKNPQYPALVVANSIFGAGTHSKLFNNVREKLSLAYYASSSLNKFKGLMFVDAGIEFDNYEQAYNETILQLDNLKNGEITDDEFTFSKSTIINALNSYYDDPRYMQIYALDCLYLGISCDIEKYKTDIEKVTMEEVLKAAKNITQNTVYFLSGKSN